MFRMSSLAKLVTWAGGQMMNCQVRDFVIIHPPSYPYIIKMALNSNIQTAIPLRIAQTQKNIFAVFWQHLWLQIQPISPAGYSRIIPLYALCILLIQHPTLSLPLGCEPRVILTALCSSEQSWITVRLESHQYPAAVCQAQQFHHGT